MSISGDIDHRCRCRCRPGVWRTAEQLVFGHLPSFPRECACRSEDYVLARPASLQTSRATRRNFVAATARDGHSGSPLPPPPPGELAASRRTGCSSYRHKFDKSPGNRPASSSRPRTYLTGEKGEGRILLARENDTGGRGEGFTSGPRASTWEAITAAS